MDDVNMTLRDFAGITNRQGRPHSAFVIPAKAGIHGRRSHHVAHVRRRQHLLKKQEIGPSSAEGDTCIDGCYALRLGHGSQPAAG